MLASLALALVVQTADPCTAATAAFPVPMEALGRLGDDVAEYRRAWSVLCASSGKPAVSLAPLFEQALRIERAMVARLRDGSLEKAFATTEDPGKDPIGALGVVSRFLPAFDSDMIETVAIWVDRRAFAVRANAGNTEDRLFWSEYDRLQSGSQGELPPWVRLRRDTGFSVCLRLGEYDWAGVLQQGRRLAKPLASSAYRAELAAFETSMAKSLRAIASKPTTCACAWSSAALTDLDRAAALPDGGEVAAAARAAAVAIRTGKTKLLFDADEPDGCGAN